MSEIGVFSMIWGGLVSGLFALVHLGTLISMSVISAILEVCGTK